MSRPVDPELQQAQLPSDDNSDYISGRQSAR